MKPSLFLLVASILYVATLAISENPNDQRVEIAVLNEANWDEFVPKGKEVDAIYGDIVLRNQHLTAVIARPVATRNANMTVRNVGGCLIDLTTRDFESDQLSCFYPGGTDYAYRDFSIAIDEKEPQKSLEKSSHGKTGHVSVVAKGSDGRPSLLTTYSIASDSRSLTIATEYRNDLKKTITVVPMDYIRADGGKEEMVKTPNGTHDNFSIVDEYWQQAYLLTAEPKIQCNSNSRSSTLKYIDSGSGDFYSLKPESSQTLTRELSPGKTLFDAESAAEMADDNHQMMVVEDAAGRPLKYAILKVRQDEKKGIVRADFKGIATSSLPSGKLNVEVLHNGLSVATLEGITLASTGGSPAVIKTESYTPGTLQLNVQDEAGSGLPVKVEIVGQGETPSPNFGPETAEFAVKNLRYTPDGVVQQALAPGKYLLRISRGPEYHAEEREVEIAANQSEQVKVTLVRAIDTTGWVSTDYHSHSTPSGDNTSSQRGRVLNLVCEHVEFAPCTEHNRIDTYQHHFDELKINRWISSITGMELTGSPLPLNHQNVFPLHHHPHRQDGGAPVTDSSVETQIRRLATWDNNSEKLIQQDHPDIGWLFYDKNGDGKPDGGHADGVPFIDAMEIHPIDRALQTGNLDGVSAEAAKSNRIFKWLQLLNQGYRIPGVVNTDAHYNFHGSGWLRNWVQSSTDHPAKIDAMEMVHATEEGRVVMSNGPFLMMSVSNATGKTVSLGQDLSAPEKKVTAHVKVQCPNWHRIDTVFLLRNGRPSAELTFTQEKNGELFSLQGQGEHQTQIFEATIPIDLTEDTHIVAVAGGTKSKTGPVVGPSFVNRPPTAITNPVFVDVDGNGFTPNKDTLGRPLPVKGD